MDGKVPQTFEALWAGYDPCKEPLETEVLKEWEEDGVVLRVIRYQIGVFKGQKTMMAGVYGFPKGGSKLPGLVQIHGGGQFADYKAPLTNAKRGYATISLAWAGRISAPGYAVDSDIVNLFIEGQTGNPAFKVTTDWKGFNGYHAVERKNRPPAVFPEWKLDEVADSPRNSTWFMWELGARRALTYLEQQPEVNAEKLGVYGHSMGGKLTVMTAAADARVKAAAPSCGGVSARSEPGVAPAPIDDGVSLSQITCPIIFLNPANDFHGQIDDLQTALTEIKSKDWRITCSAHGNHQDLAEFEIATQLWFDQYLKGSFQFPATPTTRLELKTANAVPWFSVIPDTSRAIQSVDIYYTQQGRPAGTKHDMFHTMSRFWHRAKATRNGDVWSAELPLMSTDKPLWVYANVFYSLEQPVTGAGYYYGTYTAREFNLSSRMAIVSPAELEASGVRATAQPSLLIEAFDAGWEKEWFTYDASKWARSTHKVYDPQWQAPEGARLAFSVRSAQANKLVVGLDDRASEVALQGGNPWQQVVLSLNDFRDAKSSTMKDWNGLKTLRLSNKETLKAKVDGMEKTVALGGEWVGAAPEFKDLRWIELVQQPEAKLDAVEIKKIMARVADWQIANPPKSSYDHAPDRWTMGALYVGMYPWSQIDGDDKYLNYLKAQSETNGWKLGPAQHYADDHCVGALYLELYHKEKDPRMIAVLKAQFDEIIQKQPKKAKPADAPWQGPWSWCDALFMAPPVWAGLSAATGDLRYLDYMDKEWWSTSDHLYDKEEHLYFRDSNFFDKKEANGKKVFWGRGNGWVLAGLARVLQVMPQDYPTRAKYVSQFQEMAAKIASLQQADGLWRASLLDPQRYPVKETSASGFYCFGLAWGINQGLLDRATYLPRVTKAWNAMTDCVHPDGKLGNVQPIGADPQKVTADMTEVYGVGAFLLAGIEVLKLKHGRYPNLVRRQLNKRPALPKPMP